jgi:hypothetical protein
MRIGIESNGVLRDTLKKIQQEYEKWYLNENWKEMEFIENEKDIDRKVISDVTSLDLKKHLEFKNEDEIYDFLYKEHTMEIFGHASSVEYNSVNDLNDFYVDMRDNHEIIIVSDEIGKSKPASLFFLAKFGCLLEQVKFYSESTINSLWDSVDVLLTANPNLLLKHPDNKVVIKYNTFYNSDIKTENSISTLKELKTKIENLND